MKVMEIVLAGWVLVVAVVITANLLSGGLLPSPEQPGSHVAVVTDVAGVEMLEVEARMLERMRVAVSPSMNSMIERDPMWRDPAMIRAQEEYQAQQDRMLARR